jgi:molybdate transport system substrate-binding protein
MVLRVTIVSAGLAADAKELEAARALVACLGNVDAAETIRKTGLDAISQKR